MAEDALARVFNRAGPTFTLKGGEALARPGQPIDALYRLEAGRIAELKPGPDGTSRLVAVHRPGAMLGGVEALGDGVHRTSLVALRDSELRSLPIRKAERLLRRDPHVLADVARAALRRLGGPEPEASRSSSILGVVAVSQGLNARAFAERLSQSLQRLGCRTVVLGSEAALWEPAALSQMEETHDLVLMAAEQDQADFIAFCARQIDRLVLLAGPGRPHIGALPLGPGTIEAHRLVDVIVIHPPEAKHLGGADAWLTATPASRLLHIRRDSAADCDRLARIYAGKSVGLVLSGGGARAYAHVGVLRAMGELGVPIDFVAGTSMGAIIAAGVAMGWSLDEMDERLHDAFVSSSPLGDIAFPIIAMSHGAEVEERLEKHFGNVDISDLWRPFACVSTDLTNGGAYVHKRGLLRRALRSSLSLPGLLPPVIEDGRVLVDGALVDNMPAELVQAQHDGPTIGVNVAESRGLKPEDLKLEPTGVTWLATGAWRRGPPIVSILMRAATVGAGNSNEASRNALDLYIVPKLEGVELRDWKAYKPAVQAGYSAALAVADHLATMAG
ncbi:MAG: patatin-like phospholipase family protein [Caulobacteraceae bacterium]|nr:patatin-like phospholipase family protein [Caulobacteraceae bacterium]